MPENRTLSATNFEVTTTLPRAPEGYFREHFLGWSLVSTPDTDRGDPIYNPGDEITVTSPNIVVYAIWGGKHPLAILDNTGLLNFVYDYCSADDMIRDEGGCRTEYERTHALFDDNNVFTVPVKTTRASHAPWMIYYEEYESPMYGTMTRIYANPNIKSINFEPSFYAFKPTSTIEWFAILEELTEVTNLQNLNTKNVTGMSGMFYQDISLESLTIPKHFGKAAKTIDCMFTDAIALRELTFIEDEDNPENNFGSSARNMSSIFANTKSLISLDLPAGFGVRATNMDAMFDYTDYTVDYNGEVWPVVCSENSLTTIKFPVGFGSVAHRVMYMFTCFNSLDTIELPDSLGVSVTMAAYMFQQSSFETIKLPKNFGSKVRSMNRMFYGTTSLKHLDIPNSDDETKNFGYAATNMSYMFEGSAIETLALPKGFGNNVSKTTEMFKDATALKSIYVASPTDWSTKEIAVTEYSDMFSGASDLPGYNDSNANDITNAHINGESSTVGYFTNICNLYGTCQAGSGNSSPNSVAPLSTGSYNSQNINPDSTSQNTDNNNMQSPSAAPESPGPLGVTATKIDNSDAVVFAIAMTCLFSGTTMMILCIEKVKKDYREENEQF